MMQNTWDEVAWSGGGFLGNQHFPLRAFAPVCYWVGAYILGQNCFGDYYGAFDQVLHDLARDVFVPRTIDLDGPVSGFLVGPHLYSDSPHDDGHLHLERTVAGRNRLWTCREWLASMPCKTFPTPG